MWMPTCNSAQTETEKKVDSLLLILNTKKEDTSKVNLYFEICNEYKNHNEIKMKFYNDKLLALSKKSGYKKGIGFYYLSNIHLKSNNSNDAFLEAQKASNIFLELKDTVFFLKSRFSLASNYCYNKKANEALKILNDNLKIALQIKKVDIIADFYTLIGRITYDDGFLKEALDYYKKALIYYNKSKHVSRNKSKLYLYMAFMYSDLGQYKESLRYLDLAKKIDPTTNINYEKCIVLDRLKLYPEELKLLLESKKHMIGKPISEKNYYQYSLSAVYYNLKKSNLAIESLNQISTKNNSADTNIDIYRLYADSYVSIKKYSQARFYINKAITLTDSVKNPELIVDVYLNKSNIEEIIGDYKTALFYQKKYSDCKQKINDKINKDKISELQIDFDVTGKNNKIKNLQVLDLQKKIENNKQKNYLYIISILLLVALLSVFFFIKINRDTKHKNEIIGINNIKLENAHLLSQKSLAEKEILLKEIHHRVKNNLQLVMSLLNIQSRESEKNNSKDFLEISQSRITSIALIHETLYQSDNLNQVNFKDYLKNFNRCHYKNV